jgi:hypothetical protein
MLRKHAKSLETVVGAYTRNVERHIPIHPECAASVLGELAADEPFRRRHRHVQRLGRTPSDPQRAAPGDRFVPCTARWPTRCRTPSARGSPIAAVR